MELEIFKAIVHVLDSSGGAPVFSDCVLELQEDTLDYLAAHIEKAYCSDAVKNCCFLPEATFPSLLLDNEDFVQCSKQIAVEFFEIMRHNPTIPNADLIVVYCSIDGNDSVAILKMNYKAAFAHFYQQVEGQHYNALIKQRTILPAASGKTDESVIVNMKDGSIKLVEKKFEIDGGKEFYISNRILRSTQAQPERVKLQAVQAAASQAIKENYEDSKKVECEIATILCEEAAAGDGNLAVQRVKERIEEQFPLAVPDFTAELETANVTVEEQVTVSAAKIKKMEYQSIKTDSGIEMKIPINLLTSENDYLEFINSPDGTISVLIKGVTL